MSEPDEQRFDFGFDAPVRESKRTGRGSRSSGSDRTSRGEGGTPAPDATSEELLARIARLKARAEKTQRGTIEVTEPSIDLVIDEVPSLVARVDVDPLGYLDDEIAREAPPAITIAEFYKRIKRALSGEFADSVWVRGEIRSIKVSNGHHYFELADQGADQRATQVLEVACWKTQWPSVEASLRDANVELEVGQVISVLGRISVWEAAAKIRFNLSKIDVEALLGGIAAARAQLLAALREEGILETNRQLHVATVPLRIGLVTSQGSQAHLDFMGELDRSGFNFTVEFAHSQVQGGEAPEQIAAAIRRVLDAAPDLIVIVRGGGSRNDLAAFDQEAVARAILSSSVPIWVGIGHTGDHSVADDVANAYFITPTACGEAIVGRVSAYWEGVVARATYISGLARNRLVGAEQYLLQIRPRFVASTSAQVARYERDRIARLTLIASAATHLVRAQRDGLVGRRDRLSRGVVDEISRKHLVTRQRAELLGAFDPSRQLARGWAMFRASDGHLVRSVTELRSGDRATVRLVDGEVGVTVEATRSISSGSGASQEKREPT